MVVYVRFLLNTIIGTFNFNLDGKNWELANSLLYRLRSRNMSCCRRMSVLSQNYVV
jgi:hypothetical protein